MLRTANKNNLTMKIRRSYQNNSTIDLGYTFDWLKSPSKYNRDSIRTHIFLISVLVDQSDNSTVMEGEPVNFFCKFESDLAVRTTWVRIVGKNFDPKDSASFGLVVNGSNREPVVGERLDIRRAEVIDEGTYICAGQTNSGMTPGFLHLKVFSLGHPGLLFVFSNKHYNFYNK